MTLSFGYRGYAKPVCAMMPSMGEAQGMQDMLAVSEKKVATETETFPALELKHIQSFSVILCLMRTTQIWYLQKE